MVSAVAMVAEGCCQALTLCEVFGLTGSGIACCVRVVREDKYESEETEEIYQRYLEKLVRSPPVQVVPVASLTCSPGSDTASADIVASFHVGGNGVMPCESGR